MSKNLYSTMPHPPCRICGENDTAVYAWRGYTRVDVETAQAPAGRVRVWCRSPRCQPGFFFMSYDLNAKVAKYLPDDYEGTLNSL